MIKCIQLQKTLFILGLVALSACSQETDPNLALEKSLANAEYPIDISSSGKAKLTDGLFQEQAAPNSSANNTVTLLFEKTAWGDLNHDGKKDAAVILFGDGGGSGTFFYLSAVLNKEMVMVPVDTTLLGDRVAINTVNIDATGNIIVELLTRAENEPMSSVPSVKTSIEFSFENNKLHKMIK